ncbi:MAG TPA: pyruvate kinase [Candidatus Limnocylindrales bacterium]|nr:pyruvate kinase [Candidatus Limnocylindrales bacterium]
MTSRAHTKLVCTIGPASVERARELVDLGMSVARINFSHGTPDEQKTAFHAVRAAAHHARRSVAVMVDLPGPKIRLQDLPDGELELEVGQRFDLRTNRPSLAQEVQPGDRILLADGAVELVVLQGPENAVESDVVGHQLEQPTERPAEQEAAADEPQATEQATEQEAPSNEPPATERPNEQASDQPSVQEQPTEPATEQSAESIEQPAAEPTADALPPDRPTEQASGQPSVQEQPAAEDPEQATDQSTQPAEHAAPEAPTADQQPAAGPTDVAIPTEVVRGGLIRSRAGVNVPIERLPSNGLTEQDRDALARALELRADVIAESFVRSADDVRALRALLPRPGPLVVAKIETRLAVERFDEILQEVDGVMVARGDLGVDMPYEQVPLVQKDLVRRAHARGKFTIVATQMLESMTSARRPTRAEASDVANAVLDGADAVMLSAETAIGQYPVDAARTMMSICIATEKGASGSALDRQPAVSASDDQEAVCRAAVGLADEHPSANAIWCFTRTGRTAEILSLLRPSDPIVAFTISAIAARRVAARRGVIPVVLPATKVREPLVDQMRAAARAQGLLTDDGQTVVLVTTSSQRGGINRLELHRVE